MKSEQQVNPPSPASSEAAVEQVDPAAAPTPPDPNELSEADLEAVSGGTAAQTTEGVKKTMSTQV